MISRTFKVVSKLYAKARTMLVELRSAECDRTSAKRERTLERASEPKLIPTPEPETSERL